jgi:hypothetical protein
MFTAYSCCLEHLAVACCYSPNPALQWTVPPSAGLPSLRFTPLGAADLDR